MTVRETIEQKLTAAFSPVRLRVVDESHRHAGHAGWREGGETHFDVEVISTVFEGMARTERQRRIHRVLADELAGGVHALSLRVVTPGEDNT